jgi:dTMP kinase
MSISPDSSLTAHAYFITIEGIEGAGKSTAMKFVAEYLHTKNIPLVVTREPGGTPIAEDIRRLLLAPHEEIMAIDTELLLMFASRAQHIANVIRPALAQRQWVLCDRFTDASYAYQGGGRNIDAERIATLETWVQAELQPNLTLLLDIPVEVGVARIKDRKTQDRIEREHHAFFARARQAYLERAKRFPQRFKIINAAEKLPQVQVQLIAALQDLLNSGIRSLS